MSTEIVTRLKALKLHGMASNWPELVARCRHAALEPEQLVEQLLDAEGAERNVRSIAYQMSAARFPAHRDLAGFDFGASAVDEALVRKLHTTAFTEAAHNVVLIGGPGTGKTHLATALGIERSSGMASGCASTRRWSWSTRWRPRRPRAGLGRSRTG
nr:transposase [Methylibium sp. T29]